MYDLFPENKRKFIKRESNLYSSNIKRKKKRVKYVSDVSSASKKIADNDRKIAIKEKELYSEEVKLQKEQEKERKRLENNRTM